MNAHSKKTHSSSVTSWCRAWPGYAAFALLGSFLVVMLIVFELDGQKGQELPGNLFGHPYGLEQTDTVLGWLSAILGLGLVSCGVMTLKRGGASRFLVRTAKVVLVVFVLLSGAVWSYAARGVGQQHYIKVWDSFHYHLGPKYFEELGYFAFYDCIAQADQKTERILRREKVRDLYDYDVFLPSKKAAKRGKCRERFSEERWAEFEKDYRFYAKLSPRKVRGAVGDHGYNGTPAHAFAAGHLSNSFPITYENLVAASLIDTLPLFFMFGTLCWAVGWPLASLSAVLFFTSFTDRGYFILGSFFRYQWMIWSGLGLAMLARRRHALAGACFATAGMLNAFPVLFLLAMGGRSVLSLFQTKVISRDQTRFLAGVAAASLLLGVLSVSHANGIGNYFDFFDNMEQHTDLVTRSRIGLRYLFAYRGAYDQATYSLRATRHGMEDTAMLYYLATGALVVLLAFSTRRLGDAQASVLVAVATFFYLFGTVEYYYGIFALIVLVLHGAPLRGVTYFLLAVPFLLNAGVFWVYKGTGVLGIANNSGMSLAVLLTLLVYQAATFFPRERPWISMDRQLGQAWVGSATPRDP